MVATIAAGQVPDATLAPGQTMRIFTGAPMPAGADAVVMQEETERRGDQVTIKGGAVVGQHVRRAGEDIATGVVLVDRGHVVGAGDIGALAAEGRSWLQVVRRPRVAILPTGDELVEIDQTPGPGQIANSNSIMLAAQVEECGGLPVRSPPAPDDRDGLAAALFRSAGCSVEVSYPWGCVARQGLMGPRAASAVV
jgi:molybdopterin molybdotransferase